MYQVGIDIGSSAAKVAVIKDDEVVKTMLLDTGFSSRKVADEIYAALVSDGITKDNAKCMTAISAGFPFRMRTMW